MIEKIRYLLLMRRLRAEISRFVSEDTANSSVPRRERKNSSGMTACKACGSIV